MVAIRKDFVTPITFPARPINGGPLEKSREKFGRHLSSWKVNGFRTMVHAPTGAMFNRKNERLSIRHEFEESLDRLRACPFEWVDAEALERRHNIGRGTLVVLDAVIPGALSERYGRLLDAFPGGLLKADEQPRDNSVLLMPELDLPREDQLSLWKRLQEINADWGCEYYEGLVGKLASSRYPIQLHRADQTFPYWVKHRWRW